MFSVVTLTYNRRDFLKKAIESVLAQTYTDFEYIIVDDGSTDDSESLIKSFNDKRVRYIYCTHSGYLSKLKNTALNHAKGEYIAFLDSDDVWEPNFLQMTKAAFDLGADSVICNAYILKNGVKKPHFKNESSLKLTGNLLKQRLFNDDFIIYTPCFSYRTKIPRQRYNEQLKSGDSDFFLRVLSNGNSRVILDKLTVITKHDTSFTTELNQDAPFIMAYREDLETFKLLKEQKKISGFVYQKISSIYLYRLACNLKRLALHEEAKKTFRAAFLIFPFNAKAFIRWFYASIR